MGIKTKRRIQQSTNNPILFKAVLSLATPNHPLRIRRSLGDLKKSHCGHMRVTQCFRAMKMTIPRIWKCCKTVFHATTIRLSENVHVLLIFMILHFASFYVSYLYPYFLLTSIYIYIYIYMLLNYACATAVF